MSLFKTGLFLITLSVSALAQNNSFLKPQRHKLLYADTVYNQAIAKKDTPMLAEAYYLYGKTYEATGDRLTAQRWFFKSLRLLEPKGDSPALCRLYIKFGGAEMAQENYREAVHYMRHATSMAKRIDAPKYINRAYGGMAAIHSKDWSQKGKKPGLPRAHPDSALYYYQKVETLAIAMQDSLELANINRTIGNFKWVNYNNERELLIRLEKSLDIYTRLKADGERVFTLFSFAHYYTVTNQNVLAWEALENARKIYQSHPFNDFYHELQFASLYMDFYQTNGNWQKAFEFSKKLRTLETANYTTERDLAFSRLAKDYEADKKDALLRSKDNELLLRTDALRAQQRFTITATILLFMAAAMSLVFYRLYKKNLKVGAHNEVLVREQNHRVKNNLQAISSMLRLQSKALSDPIVAKAIEESLLRVEAMAILHRKLYDGRHLAKVYLPDFIEDLAEGVLQTYGFETVELATDIDLLYLSADQAIHVGLILNELLTNACKYAFPGHDDPALTISCKKFVVRNQNRIALTVSDNGAGSLDSAVMQETSSKKTGSLWKDDPESSPRKASTHVPGFGMQLIKMEAEQLYATYSFSFETGTTFKMDFREEAFDALPEA